MPPSFPLYLALALYALGTLIVLSSLVFRAHGWQRAATILMGIGFLSHAVWIGTICSKTGHPPITNLPETTSFIAWTILLVKLVLWLRYRVDAASFLIYPLVFLLLGISAVVGEQYTPLAADLRSNIFIAHLLLTTVGIAALLVGIGFTVLYQVQERSLRAKTRGRLWEWIPSLRVCDFVSYRALSIGFAIYTVGIVAGILFSYRTSATGWSPGVKEYGAFAAWIFFAALLQSYMAGNYRERRTLVIAGVAVVAIFVSILGIAHV
ncbi:MAG TPA: cytochrome c biogenesis protein CcsA [Thermoanaerobaculia bacterium]|nr:cytochrome c biogenesis protein CcsA [Thermoanaerobaculia bacterium]